MACLFSALVSNSINAQKAELSLLKDGEIFSPDKRTKLTVWENKEEGSFYYSVSQDEDTVLEISAIGIKTKSVDFCSGCTLGNVKVEYSLKNSYTLITGKTSSVCDDYSELTFELFPSNKASKISKCNVIFRCYNDGIAYRYQIFGKNGSKEEVKSESSSFNLPQKDTFLYVGNTSNTYEVDYNKIPMRNFFRTGGKYTVPALAEIKNGAAWVLITEANVFNEEEPYCASYLNKKVKSSSLNFIFGNKVSKVVMKYNEDGFFFTPWRCAVITHDIEKLFQSTIITSLNPKADEEKYNYSSWVKGIKADWSWWSEAGDDPIEFAPQKDYIDFAYNNGWDAVCLDFGWCLWEDYKNKVLELCDYAALKGIKIMLWYGVNNECHSRWLDANGKAAYPTYSLQDEKQLREQFKWAHEAGVYAVKVDYYESDTQETMKQMQLCAKIAAENRLCVLFHGCTNPGGENRTYPNILSYEAVFGEEYHKFGWTSPTIDTLLTFPFTRNVCGSMDYTPAALPVVSIPATAAFNLAETVVFESATLNLASSIYAYEGNPALAFLNEIEPCFEKSILCDKKNIKPAQYVAVARKARNKEKWFVGAMTKKSRTTEISLDFLDSGSYNAIIFSDEDGGAKVQYERMKVTKDTVIREFLKENGGLCMVIGKEDFVIRPESFNYYGAENSECAHLSKGAEIVTNPFASGLKEARVGFGKSASLEFTIQTEADGIYKMNVYFKSSKKSQIAYSLNGGEEIKTPPVCSGTNSIAKYSCFVRLKNGENKIKIWSPSSSFIGLDRIAVGKIPERNSEETLSDDTDYNFSVDEKYASLDYDTIKAEEFETNAIKEAGGFIGWLGNNPASYAEVKIHAEKNGTYILRLGYMCGADRSALISINGKSQSVMCKSSGGYDMNSLSYLFHKVQLKKGENRIRITNPNAYCPNIYSIAIAEY